MLEDIWNFKVSLSELAALIYNYRFSPVPVLATYVIFDLTWIVRAIFKKHYVPMYLMFFPTGHPDDLYARYSREDDPFSVTPRLTAPQRRQVAWRLRLSATISMLISTVISPLIVGFLAALYLSPEQFNQFLVFWLVTKAFFIWRSLSTLRRESRVAADTKTFAYLLLLYAIYLTLVVYGLAEAFNWTSANLQTYSLLALMWELVRSIYWVIFIGVIASTLAIWVFTRLFLSRADALDRAT